VVDEQVDVVVLAVERDELGVEVRAHLGHDLFAAVQHRGGEDVPPILRGEDHDVELGDDAASPAKLRVFGPSW
jgi:hypothetical protein